MATAYWHKTRLAGRAAAGPNQSGSAQPRFLLLDTLEDQVRRIRAATHALVAKDDTAGTLLESLRGRLEEAEELLARYRALQIGQTGPRDARHTPAGDPRGQTVPPK